MKNLTLSVKRYYYNCYLGSIVRDSEMNNLFHFRLIKTIVMLIFQIKHISIVPIFKSGAGSRIFKNVQRKKLPDFPGGIYFHINLTKSIFLY